MAKRILLTYPDHPKVSEIVKKISQIKSSEKFRDGSLKGLRDYLTQLEILSQDEKGHDNIHNQNLSYLLHSQMLPIWERVHDQDLSVNEGLRFKRDHPDGFPVKIHYGWITPIIDTFKPVKPDYILYHHQSFSDLVKEKFGNKKKKMKGLFTSPQTTIAGTGIFNRKDKDRYTRYEFSMHNESIEGKTGILATTFLNEDECIGIMRAAKNAGGDMIGACAMFGTKDFSPDYALVLQQLNLKREN
jgi:hypothetical protein